MQYSQYVTPLRLAISMKETGLLTLTYRTAVAAVSVLVLLPVAVGSRYRYSPLFTLILLHPRHVKTQNTAINGLSNIYSWILPRHECGWSPTPPTPRQWRPLPPPSGGTARREKVAPPPPACRCWDCCSSQCVPVSPPAVHGIQFRASLLLKFSRSFLQYGTRNFEVQYEYLRFHIAHQEVLKQRSSGVCG
jgi:hypothetical protein